jgi:hypothetical protein
MHDAVSTAAVTPAREKQAAPRNHGQKGDNTPQHKKEKGGWKQAVAESL